MFSVRLLVILFVSANLAGCSEAPACERLVERLCAAAGPTACEQLKAKGPTDHDSCQATLDDVDRLNAQLDALVAATAARELQAPPAVAPKTSTD